VERQKKFCSKVITPGCCCGIFPSSAGI
jgi:hypothetical protein